MPAYPKSTVVLGIHLALLAGSAPAQPVVKNGDCPELTRYTPTEDNWNAFPVKPNGFPAGTVQDPLTAQQSVNCIKVPEGLRAELWASELTPGVAPGLAYIQHFTFDERGRMWAVEPRAYPNDIRPSANSTDDQKFQGGTDRILILEDSDGDKVADKVKVFKDGLNLPQSILVVKGGILVTMTPYVVYFPNDNDVAGPPRILFSGMGDGDSPTSWDTQGTINSLMYGLDNWIYGHTGYNRCKVGGVDCGMGRVWRFQHTAIGHAADRFEVWTKGPSNAWGIGQMEDGQIFQSGASGTPHISHSLRQGAAPVDIRSPAGSGLFYPITGDRYLYEGSTARNAEGHFISRSTAVSGLQIYTSRLLPPKYWNRFAFSCEGASKLCNQDSLVVSTDSAHAGITGSTWRAVRMPYPDRSNIIASTDAWVAPILATTGPDGAVWVLDWYNYLVLHVPLIPSGPGRGWINKLREKSRVRIYRVTPADGRTEPILDLAAATVPQLVDALANPNMLWRLHAQRLLIGKGWSDDLGARLADILETDHAVDTVGNNPRVVHALWTLHGLGRFAADAVRWSPVLADLLKHPAWGVRRNALMAMPNTAATAAAIDAACSVNDGHGHVRLQALVALGGIGSKPAGLQAMWDAYANVDAHAAGAFAQAGIPSAATRPCEPALHPRTPPVAVERAAARPRTDLLFRSTANGFELLAQGRLPDGELTVWNAQGQVVFRSSYAAGARRWSRTRAEGLSGGIHLYSFRGGDGTRIQGRLGLTGRL